MERFCGHLLPAVKNRVRPYDHLDYYIQRCAQMQIVSAIYDLPALTKGAVASTSKNDWELSARETTYPECKHNTSPLQIVTERCKVAGIILGAPVDKRVELNTQLMNQLTKYFGVVYPEHSAQQLRARIARNSLIRYGRFRLAGDGDCVRTADLVAQDPLARDNSYVRVS
jgi:hypothetical protein